MIGDSIVYEYGRRMPAIWGELGLTRLRSFHYSINRSFAGLDEQFGGLAQHTEAVRSALAV